MTEDLSRRRFLLAGVGGVAAGLGGGSVVHAIGHAATHDGPSAVDVGFCAGENIVALVPVVTPCSYSQATASA